MVLQSIIVHVMAVATAPLLAVTASHDKSFVLKLIALSFK